MWSTLQSIGGFINRNRTKIAVATVIAVGVTLYLTYNSEPEQIEEAEAQEFRPLQVGNESKAKKAANRTRLLFKARRQFDTSASQFLPTLRTKIIEVIDINGTVKHIKELRARATNNKDELEARLWAEIKDASFALLIVTAYMLAAVCTLLRIQLHILARTMHQSYMAEGEDSDVQLNSEMFRMLIEGTYKHLFSTGLKSFAERVKSQIGVSLADWTVKDKLHVDYEEVVQALGAVRQALEADMSELIRTIFIRKRPMLVVTDYAMLTFLLVTDSVGGGHNRCDRSHRWRSSAGSDWVCGSAGGTRRHRAKPPGSGEGLLACGD